MATPSQDLKTCTICGVAKPKETDFYFRRRDNCYYAWCKECCKARTRQRWHGERHDEIAAHENAAMKIKRVRIRRAILAAYGNICACCGETEETFLTLDHINNDGAEYRRTALGKRTRAGYWQYQWVIKHGFPAGFQILCMNCQQGKRMNNGVCPHQVRRNDQRLALVEPSGSKRNASDQPNTLAG